MLTAEQIAFFQEHGYLILKNLIDPEIVDEWRAQVWKHFNSSLETPETWPNDYVVQNFSFSPLLGQLPAMQEITEQLGGGQFTGGGGSPLVKWPNPEEEWAMPGNGHIDAYGPGGWSPFMLGATTYLYDVEPAAVGSFFGPEVTIQPTSTSFNIRSRLMAVSTILRIGDGMCFRIYLRTDLVSLSVPRVMLCCGTRFSAIPVQRMSKMFPVLGSSHATPIKSGRRLNTKFQRTSGNIGSFEQWLYGV